MFESLNLNITWFVLIVGLFAMYAIMDGFDLGTGILYLLDRNEEDRRIMLKAIGPVWDGNEVWLLTAGGALFAAFPKVYATVFSGFYTAFMMLLLALIFRAVSIEFRNKQPMLWWRRIWDIGFGGGSLLAVFLFGVAFGNMARGIPLDAQYEFAGTFFGLLNPFSLLTGLLAVVLSVMHGSIFLLKKTEDLLQKKAYKWFHQSFFTLVGVLAVVLVLTFLMLPHMVINAEKTPLTVIILFAALLLLVGTIKTVHLFKYRRALVFSGLMIACLIGFYASGLFPNLVLSNPAQAYSLTIYNAASSAKTLSIMLTIALIGLPLVGIYTGFVYWVFRGKVKLDSTGY